MSAERMFTPRRRGTLPLSFQATCAQTCVPRRWEDVRKALYGTRQTPASWGDELLAVGDVSRCCFRNQSGSVAGEAVHGDDIFGAGPREEALELEALLKERWETRDQLIGLESGDEKELHVLNRTQRWFRDGLVCAADVRHAKEVVGELGWPSEHLFSELRAWEIHAGRLGETLRCTLPEDSATRSSLPAGDSLASRVRSL